jgi:hypothetical protein
MLFLPPIKESCRQNLSYSMPGNIFDFVKGTLWKITASKPKTQERKVGRAP